ncbi:DUF1573 domain-containing protein [Polaribacter litorisediminis]|uniref:DUF1573 domain-containing protein n=1 Tax=Polaribacter litorisediminis TaxID=1908341 RepID=UPI001CBCCDEB|nr:DUF1573 domain-containing protein [Polaribacter litorisediminis]UAM98031.1 DUF1573 domain-containing protein [Polaribacter litorisediminis]
MIKKTVILIFIFVIFFLISYSIRKPNDFKRILSKKTTIKLENQHYNFDKLKLFKADSIYFSYKNIGENDFKIESVKASCGCTIPFWSKKKLKPNDIDSILVVYDSNKKGRFSKEIFIVSNNETSPLTLRVSGIVMD